MSVSQINISVERLLEQEVDEINRSGEERYIKPFSMSEELTHFASKIDFYEGIDSVETTIDDGESVEKESGNQTDSNSEKKWHWEGVHSKLRTALSETCVMLDVLQNLNKKKYLVLDPIVQNVAQEKQTVQMLEKRKYLARAGSIIAKGAAILHNKKKSNDFGPIIVEDDENEYYMQLMQLRQHWRVKKSGNQITGDVSYRSVGSTYWHPGLFEVKADHNSNSDEKTLAVNVSPDLVLNSEIKITIVDKNMQHPSAETSTISYKPHISKNAWEQKLKLAQQHLYNKELFSSLSNAAFQGSFVGIEVLESKITCQLLEDVDIIITHEIDQLNEQQIPKEEPGAIEDNNINLVLTQLLQKQHKLNLKRFHPYPSTSNHLEKQSKSSTLFNLLNGSLRKPRKSILHEFIVQMTHHVWKKRLRNYFDAKNNSMNDPVLLMHINSANSKLNGAMTISIITSANFMATIRTSFLLSITTKGFTLTFDDASNVDLPFDLTTLDVFINSKIQVHLLKVCKSLCMSYGWSIPISGSGTCNGISNRGSIFTCKSISKHRSIYLNVTNIDGIEVEISTGHIPEFIHKDFKHLSESRTTLTWDTIYGKTFVEKFKTLLFSN